MAETLFRGKPLARKPCREGRSRFAHGLLALGSLIAVAAGCSGPAGGSLEPSEVEPGADPAALAVSSPYLAAVVGDLLGEGFPMVVLAEPGMCPGHFDLRPSLIRRAVECRLLVRFAFQQSLDARLAGSGHTPPQVVAVELPGGMCEPASYTEAARQVAGALVADGFLQRADADARLADIAARMDALTDWAAGQIAAAGLEGAPVLTSGHQAAFARSLGLDVVGTFSAADTALPSQINRAVQQGQKAGVTLVVANLPEGRQLADALADRLDAVVVVFGNFPEADDPEAFDRLVRGNVTALLETVGP